MTILSFYVNSSRTVTGQASVVYLGKYYYFESTTQVLLRLLIKHTWKATKRNDSRKYTNTRFKEKNVIMTI